jgi:hypothetical protein
VTIDPLYKGYLKHWIALNFNVQLLMRKARHGFFDIGFNKLVQILADTYLEGNKVLANIYRAKKVI